jgi:hypothetical protein
MRPFLETHFGSIGRDRQSKKRPRAPPAPLLAVPTAAAGHRLRARASARRRAGLSEQWKKEKEIRKKVKAGEAKREAERRERLRRRPQYHPEKRVDGKGKSNADRIHRTQFTEYSFNGGRLGAQARLDAKRLAKAKRAKGADDIIKIEDVLRQYPRRAASATSFIDAWAANTAAAPRLYQFYGVQQKAGQRRYRSFNARKSALEREFKMFRQQFAIDAVPAVLAVGTWRPAGGFHFRGHAPTVSVRVRKRLESLANVVVVHVPEPYAAPLLSSPLLSSLFLFRCRCQRADRRRCRARLLRFCSFTTHTCPDCHERMSRSGVSLRRTTIGSRKPRNSRGVRRCTSNLYAARRDSESPVPLGVARSLTPVLACRRRAGAALGFGRVTTELPSTLRPTCATSC